MVFVFSQWELLWRLPAESENRHC